MSNLKSRVEKMESKIKKSSNYAEIIKRHSIESRKGCGPDEGMTMHTVMALYINLHPEHKGSLEARNYLEWINGYNSKVIDGAYSAIQDLMAAGLAKFMPTEFISDGRDTSSMIPPYPYLCNNAEQILHYADSMDTQFWTDLK